MTASGSVTRGDHREPPVAEEHEQHDDGEEAADQDRVAHAGDRLVDELGQVVDPVILMPAGSVCARSRSARPRRL